MEVKNILRNNHNITIISYNYQIIVNNYYSSTKLKAHEKANLTFIRHHCLSFQHC